MLVWSSCQYPLQYFRWSTKYLVNLTLDKFQMLWHPYWIWQRIEKTSEQLYERKMQIFFLLLIAECVQINTSFMAKVGHDFTFTYRTYNLLMESKRKLKHLDDFIFASVQP